MPWNSSPPKGDPAILAGIGPEPDLIEPAHALLDHQVVAKRGDAAQIDLVRSRDHRPPVARRRRIGLGQPEIDVIVVGEDPQLPVRGIRRIDHLRPPRRDQRQRRQRIGGGHEPHFRRAVVAGRDEDQAAIVALADRDRKALVLDLLIERDVLVRRIAQPMQPSAIAAPILIDLGERQPPRIRGPHRAADADLGDGLDILAGRQVADLELEPFRSVVVDHRRRIAPVRADLDRAQPK